MDGWAGRCNMTGIDGISGMPPSNETSKLQGKDEQPKADEKKIIKTTEDWKTFDPDSMKAFEESFGMNVFSQFQKSSRHMIEEMKKQRREGG